MLNGGQLAARTLAEAGVDTVFALHGGHLDAFLTGCVRYGIALVDCRHEAAAVNAADGYARTTGRIGVAAVTAGPGLFNSVAGISNAAADSVPVVVITSSPPLREEETGELQGGLDQLGVVAPITRWAQRAYAAERVPDLVGLAVRHATSAVSGPVVLDIPIDVGFRPVPIDRIPPSGRPIAPTSPVPAPEVIAEAARLLSTAEHPVLVLGDASLSADAGDALRRLVDATGVPVFSGSLSRGMLPGSDARSGGSVASLAALGMAGVETPDLVVLVGASFGLLLGGRRFWEMVPGAKIVQLHPDPAEIGRLGPVDVAVLGDLAAGLDALAQQATVGDVSGWTARATGLKRLGDLLFESAAMEDDGIHPHRVAKEVADTLPPDTILVRDGGETAQWMDWALGTSDVVQSVTFGYQGHLGVGQGFSIGAQVAHPGSRVVQVTGDGAIGFHIQEWDTMVRHELPIVTVVFNNASWGMSIHGQHAVYGPDGDVISRLAPTRYDLVAEGFGAFGQHVSDIDGIRPAMERAFDSDRPSVINVVTSAKVVHPLTLSLLGDLSGDDGIALPYYENLDSP